MDDLVFCLDPQAHLVSKEYGLARRYHPERREYHLNLQACAGPRNLLGGDGGEEEEGEGMAMLMGTGMCVPHLEQMSEYVKRATEVNV